jgi:hypothetical protein
MGKMTVITAAIKKIKCAFEFLPSFIQIFAVLYLQDPVDSSINKEKRKQTKADKQRKACKKRKAALQQVVLCRSVHQALSPTASFSTYAVSLSFSSNGLNAFLAVIKVAVS